MGLSRRTGVFTGLGIVALVLVVLVGRRVVAVDDGEAPPDPAALSATSYLVSAAEDTGDQRAGVVLHDPGLSYGGLTMLGSYVPPTLHLMGIDGKTVHTWQPAATKVLPPHAFVAEGVTWARPSSKGRILAISGHSLLEMDHRGRVHWRAPKTWHYHHDFEVGPEGEVYALASRQRTVELRGKVVDVLDDAIVIFSATRKEVGSISLYDLFGTRIPAEHLELLVAAAAGKAPSDAEVERRLALDTAIDVLHANSVRWVDRDVGPIKKGDLLICIRSMDLVAAVDPVQRRVRWTWEKGRQVLDRPHAPFLLTSDRILLFDNGWRRNSSRVLELDPQTGEITWQCTGSRSNSLWTRWGGMAQPLPNGNVLITVTMQGRVVEMTRRGQIAWEYRSDKRDTRPQPDGKVRWQAIYRAWRLLPDEVRELASDPVLAGKLRRAGY